MERLSVGQILVRMGALPKEQIPKVLEFSKANNEKFGDACLKLDLCSEEQVYRALAKHFQLPFANLSGKTIPPELIELVPKEVATEHSIVPVAAKDGRITVALADPTDFFVIQDNLRFLLNREVSCALATPQALEEALDHHYRLTGDLSGVIGEAEDAQDQQGLGSEEELEANDAPIIKLVQFLISNAIKERASDIHVEPMADRVRIHVVTADTFGKARAQLEDMPGELVVLPTVDQAAGKLAYVERLGCDRTACIGNGRNDHQMLKEAALGIAVIGPEGASPETVASADAALRPSPRSCGAAGVWLLLRPVNSPNRSSNSLSDSCGTSLAAGA